jgi:hypothetical protein
LKNFLRKKYEISTVGKNNLKILLKQRYLGSHPEILTKMLVGAQDFDKEDVSGISNKQSQDNDASGPREKI